jgi:hypothetical protein
VSYINCWEVHAELSDLVSQEGSDAVSYNYRTIRPKRYEVMGGWRKLHNEQLRLCSSPSIIRMITARRKMWAGHVARMEKRKGYRIWVGKREGTRPLGRPRHMWVDNIKMDLLLKQHW